jgi:hypothetical protein
MESVLAGETITVGEFGKAKDLLAQDWRDRDSVVRHFENDRENLLVPRDVSGQLEEHGGQLTEEEVRGAFERAERAPELVLGSYRGRE